MQPVETIGMGLTPRDLPSHLLDLIRQAQVLVGGARHLEGFKDHPGTKKVITGDLAGTTHFIHQRMPREKIVVLASGDPLFYGVGSYLAKQLGPENIIIHPNVSSIAAAFARLKIAWQDATTISFHGRNDQNVLWQAVARYDKIAVLTDPKRNPSWLAQRLMDRGREEFAIWVLEQLGTPAEKVTRCTPQQASKATFCEPNVVVLIRDPARRIAAGTVHDLHLGVPDDRFVHEAGLITKAEVRAVTLSKLRLQPHHTLWDLGAGSGSVGIEAAGLVRHGQVFAVEKNHDRVAQIEQNKQRFAVSNFTVVQGTLPAGLESLPTPERVFIGGGGQHLARIISAAAELLAIKGRIVVNTVILKSVTCALEVLSQLGFETEVVQIQISRSRPMPWGERLQAENPVFIISATKKEMPDGRIE